MIPWIVISILILLILFGVLAFLLTRKKKHKPDYYSFFIMGLTWMVIGGGLMIIRRYNDLNFLFFIGLIFFVIGLANKDKWKKNRRTWKNMDKNERIIYIVAMVLVGVLVLAGFVVYFLVNKGIISLS